MTFTVDIDDKLLEEIVELSGLKDKQEIVTKAAQNYLKRYRAQLESIKQFGTFDLEPDYDDKIRHG